MFRGEVAQQKCDGIDGCGIAVDNRLYRSRTHTLRRQLFLRNGVPT